jgi:Na+/H+-translocating membrane pyrophosphatase
MTTFKDVGGLTSVKAVKIDGASKWLAKSSVAVALDTTNNCSVVCSFTNAITLSPTTALNVESCTTQQLAQHYCGLVRALADAGIMTSYYDGTNKNG